MNRTSAPALFRKQTGPLGSGEHYLRLPPQYTWNMREATARCVAAVCKTAPPGQTPQVQLLPRIRPRGTRNPEEEPRLPA